MTVSAELWRKQIKFKHASLFRKIAHNTQTSSFAFLMTYVNARSIRVQTKELLLEKEEWVTIWIFAITL